MLKDNHIWSAGNITESVQRARFACGFSMKASRCIGFIGYIGYVGYIG